MRFPNKLTSLKESSLPIFALILCKLQEDDYTPIKLFNEIKKSAAFKNTNATLADYNLILDCLYILGKIELIGEEVIHYVGRN